MFCWVSYLEREKGIENSQDLPLCIVGNGVLGCSGVVDAQKLPTQPLDGVSGFLLVVESEKLMTQPLNGVLRRGGVLEIEYAEELDASLRSLLLRKEMFWSRFLCWGLTSCMRMCKWCLAMGTLMELVIVKI